MQLKQIHPLTLASQSPRRLFLLRRVGIEPIVISNSYVEEQNSGGTLSEVALANATLKAAAAAKHQEGWLLAADTLVGMEDQLLGKPRDAQQAAEMLQRLSGRTHQVVTAYAFIVGGANQPQLLRWVQSEVTFRPLTSHEINDYVKTGEPLDKAGAYGIQGQGLQFIAQVRGSSSNVMGLPMYEVVMDLVRLRLAYFAGVN